VKIEAVDPIDDRKIKEDMAKTIKEAKEKRAGELLKR